jgi:PAS domain S-box-containing protein
MSRSHAPGNPKAELGGIAGVYGHEWFQITLSCIGDGVIASDREGRVKYLNPVAEKLTGWTLTDAVGEEIERVFHIVHEKTKTPFQQPVRKVIHRGLTVELGEHALLVARDGSERPIDDCAAPIKDERGDIVGVVLIFRDITERRQAEQLIELAKEYAESIVATVREPLIILDSELRVRSANRSFYETFKVEPADTEGRSVYELGNGQWNIPALRTLLEETLPLQSSFDDFEVQHDFTHIGPKTMLLNARCFPPEGRFEAILLAIEDITDRKRTEAVLLDSARQKDEINAKLAMAHDRVSRDLKAAAKVQETYLPHELPRVPGTAFAWIYRPCDDLGGDGLNVIPLGGGRIALYILDVSGHGVASALLAVTLSRILSAPSETSSILMQNGDVADRPAITPPAVVADRLNLLFPYNMTTEQLATMIYGVLDASTGEFRYVSAGHPGPVHLPVTAGPVILGSPGFPIGLADDPYEERYVRLAAGDRLYLYSDGVTEMMGPAGQLFGDARLLETIDRGRSLPLQQSVADLVGAVERWRDAASAHDDISIVAVEFSVASVPGEPDDATRLSIAQPSTRPFIAI